MKLQKFWSRKSSTSSGSSSSSPRSPPTEVKSSTARSQSAEIYSDSSTSWAPSTSSPLPRHIQELHDAFQYFDSNGDGKISVVELGCVLRSLGDNPSKEDLESMVREVDADGDGFVCLEEFISLNTKSGIDQVTGSMASVEELQAVFGVFDADRNGYISADELYAVLLKLGEKGVTMEDCYRMIGGVDADGDGKVDFEEFKRMMTASLAT